MPVAAHLAASSGKDPAGMQRPRRAIESETPAVA